MLKQTITKIIIKMEELQKLLKYLKENGYGDIKISADLVVGLIQYFTSKENNVKRVTDEDWEEIENSGLDKKLKEW